MKQSIKDLFEEADINMKNIENIFSEMREKGIKICSNCGCSVNTIDDYKCKNCNT